jgi:citrate lyase subunit beta/citryl-CoA lyase
MKLTVNRCVLFVPVNNPRFTEKAWTRGADAIILDLEDSVPMSEKEKARKLVKEVIPKVSKGGASIFVRINKEFIEEDLRASIWPGISRVMLPKTESTNEVNLVDRLLTELEKERGIPVGTIEIRPMLESALGVVNSYAIASSSPRVKVMSDGGGGYDMSLDLEIEMFAEFDQYAYIRGECSITEMAAGVEVTTTPYISGTTGRVNDREQGMALAKVLHDMHVREALALHPAFVEPIVTGLTPTSEEVRWAKKIVEAYEQIEQDGENICRLRGQRVDIYKYRKALELIKWANACYTKDNKKTRAIAKAQLAEDV